MIIRLGTSSFAGVMLIASLVAILPCALANVTTELPGHRESNPANESSVVNYGVVLQKPMSNREESLDEDAPAERGAIKKRHLASLARDGDMAARRLHRNSWWDQVANRAEEYDEEDPAFSGVSKRTLASLARLGDSTARRIHYEKRDQDDHESDPESSFELDDDGLVPEQDKRNLASMARLGDDAARRINYQTRSWEDPLTGWRENGGHENENLHSKRNLAALAKHGDAAARRLNSQKRQLWDEEATEYNDQFIDPAEYEKRSLATMARDGDVAARRLNVHHKRILDGEDAEYDAAEYEKRSLATMARDGDNAARRLSSHQKRLLDVDDVEYDKRSLATMAKDGDTAARRLNSHQKRLLDGDDAEYDKRSLATMARDGDNAARRLNSHQKRLLDGDDAEYDKRSLATMARDGDTAARRLNSHQKRLLDVEDGEYDKRSLATMARDGDNAARRLSSHQKRLLDAEDGEYDKRSLATMARDGDNAARRLSSHQKRLLDAEDGEYDKRSLATMARDGDNAARRLNSNQKRLLDTDDAEYDKRSLASMARDGDAAARRLNGQEKRLLEGEAAYYDPQDFDSPDYEKRNLAAMARHGDLAARKLYLSKGGMVSLPVREEDVPVKRHLGALAREGALKNMWEFGKGVPRPWNYGLPDRWYKQPKRHNDDDVDDNDEETWVESEEAGEGSDVPLTMVKKHIAALARRGSLINLRWQRRPLPPNWYKNSDDTIKSNGGYKRNIQSLARMAAPGSGYRSWSRGRFWGPTDPFYQFNGRLRSTGSRDRARGVRSTREGYMDTLPRSPAALAYRPVYGNYDAFRAPMAFVSRHMFKRALGGIYPVIPGELLRLEDPLPLSTIELPKTSSEQVEKDPPDGPSKALPLKPKGPKERLGEHDPSSKDKH